MTRITLFTCGDKADAPTRKCWTGSRMPSAPGSTAPLINGSDLTLASLRAVPFGTVPVIRTLLDFHPAGTPRIARIQASQSAGLRPCCGCRVRPFARDHMSLPYRFRRALALLACLPLAALAQDAPPPIPASTYVPLQ